MKSFFPELEKTEKYTEFDSECAAKLLAIVQNVSKIRRHYSLKRWANSFRLLRQDGIEEKDITKAIDWYADNAGRPYVPRIYSANSFRAKFESLWDALVRDGQTDFEISEKTQRLAKRFERLNWRGLKPEVLSQAIQLSANRYDEFLGCLERFDGQPRDARLAKALMSKFPPNYIEQWFLRVNDMINNWQEWNGSLEYFIFYVGHKWFLHELKQHALGYGRQEKDVLALLEKITP